jgi:uncharacterized protein (TIGR00645 family)
MQHMSPMIDLIGWERLISGLKIKLIGSLVAISVIELLKDFIELSGQEKVGEGTIWRVIIHLTFVISGVLFALMDWIADKREVHGPSSSKK